MYEYPLFFVGIFLLVKGAGYVADGASALAKKLGVPTLVIGLTVVAFGTSLPELVVNVLAALNGRTDIAIGNILGSNISNLLLVLGLTASVFALTVRHSTVWKEIPISLFAALVLLVLANDILIDKSGLSVLSRTDGLVMLFLFGIFLYYTFDLGRKNRDSLADRKLQVKKHKWSAIAILTIGGLGAVILGGKWVIDGVVLAATQFGLSEFVISATIVAVGTSLPEIAISFVAALKGDPDLSVGNIVGSNIFNILLVLGITSIITPITVQPFMNFEMLFIVFISLLLFAYMYIGKKHKVQTWQGMSFVLLYIGYIAFVLMRGISI